MEEVKIIPRDYQKSIIETCEKKSCLVVLPTGTGKTLIALYLAINIFKKNPLQKIVFLAPTRPLIEQHINYFNKYLPDGFAQLDLFTGKTPAAQRKKIWQRAEFIFSTPQCISNDLKKNLYDLSDVCLLIQDECHRCLKNYSYTFISQKYKEQNKNPHVLGLTASPGSNKETIQSVCRNLGIEAVEIRTRESEDVKPYLQEREFEKIEVELPKELVDIKYTLNNIYTDKIDDLKEMRVLFGPATKVSLLECQKRLFNKLNSGDKNPSYFQAISVCTQAIKISHLMELLETQTTESFLNYIKTIFKEAVDKKSKASQFLYKDSRMQKIYNIASDINIEHPKLNKIKEIVENTFSENEKSKIIIFAQFRETVKKISDILSEVDDARTGVFVGQSIKKHGDENSTTGLKQEEQKEMIRKFSSGEINILCATSIAEEGLDIPEVSEVIFYEPVPSAIRTIQRAGRTARLFPGKLKILVTKNTRDQVYHYAAQAKEKRMRNAIEDIKKEFDSDQKKLLFKNE